MSRQASVGQQQIHSKEQEDTDQGQKNQGQGDAESNADAESTVVSWRDVEADKFKHSNQVGA